MAQQGEPREINLGALSPQELQNLKNMYEEDIKSLSSALQQLRVARDRYKAGENGLEQLKKSKDGTANCCHNFISNFVVKY